MKIKRYDKVTVVGYAVGDDVHEGEDVVYLSWLDQGKVIKVPLSMVVNVEQAPPMKGGDRVYRMTPITAVSGTVLHTHGLNAWVQWDDAKSDVHPIETLRRLSGYET